MANFPVEVTSKLIQFGEKKYAIAFVQDITERRRNEEALREKDRLLHDMGRLARIGAWKYAVDTRKITSTDEMNRIYDFGPGQDTGVEGHLGCYHGENHDKITRAFNEALEHGTPYDLELELLSARGVNKWVRVIGYPVMKDGRVTELQGSLQDITEIKRAVTRLKLSESRYRALIELSPLGVGMVNSDGILVDTNQALASMLGYEKEDLLGLNFKDITHPDDIALEISLLQALAKDEKSSYSLEKRYRHRSGDFFWINISVAKTSDIYGPGVFYFGFIENISNRKQMEKEREELIDDLKKALAEIRELRGFIPICASCKKIRDDEGYWQQVEKYISDRTDAKFSHGICTGMREKALSGLL
jgi:PAS domain S-box-containing protein